MVRKRDICLPDCRRYRRIFLGSMDQTKRPLEIVDVVALRLVSSPPIIEFTKHVPSLSSFPPTCIPDRLHATRVF